MVDVQGTNGPQKLALEADRNGFAYAIDRTTGKFVWGLPFVKKVTWTKGIDPESGKPLEYDSEEAGSDLQYRSHTQPGTQGRGYLPRQYGRKELASDGLQPGV